MSFSSIQYIDIHTHIRNQYDGAVSVAALSANEIHHELTPLQFSTAGIHPWWVEDFTTLEIEKLKTHILNLITENRLWGIGETGIDRTDKDSLQAQKELFFWHLELSEKWGLPLIIHSVRAGSDFLEILKDKKIQSPWIFHDFRGNLTLLNDLLRLHPKCYFSFGMSLDNSAAIRELIPQVPLDRLFLETDEQKHLDIHDIYIRASELTNLDLDFLKSQIWLNFSKITNSKLQ